MKFFWFDFETYLMQPGLQAPPAVCMSYAYDDAAGRLMHAADPEFDRVLWGAFEDPNTILVAHNAAFEVVVSMARDPERTSLIFEALRQGRVRCTMVREKLIRIARGDERPDLTYALDDTCRYWNLKIELDKKCYWRLRFGTLYHLPIEKWPSEAVAYALGDLAVRDVYRKQERVDPDYLVDQHHQTRAAVSLQLTGCWGWPTDPVTSHDLVEATEAKIAKAQETILEHRLARFEKKKGVWVVVKTKAAAEARCIAAYAARGLDVPRGKPTDKMLEEGREEGNVKLDAETCELSRDPVLEAYATFGQASTLLSKVRRLSRAADAGMPIQCSYNVLVATGRTSSRQGDDPKPDESWTAYGMQMQNQLRAGEEYVDENGKKRNRPGTRECFVARGYLEHLKELGYER